jgi:hypothetical protein
MESKKWHLIKEFSEFNYQRMNSDNAIPGVQADNPQLSINAFDKHQDVIRQAISRLGDISNSMHGSNSYRLLKSKLSLEDQEIKKLKIIRILKSEGFNYDAYITFIVGEEEYWGVIKNILTNPELKSEIFKDFDLIQTQEWIIKLKGTIIKVIKNWMKPQFGKFKLIGDEINCYSSETGKLLKLPPESEIEVLKSYDNQIIFKYGNDQYSLKGDNFVYFNWRFEEIK